MISQSSTIAFFLIAGFVIYITMKGELPDYAGVIGIGPKSKNITAPNIAETATKDSNAVMDAATFGGGG